jgi:hypothetical protein
LEGENSRGNNRPSSPFTFYIDKNREKGQGQGGFFKQLILEETIN